MSQDGGRGRAGGKGVDGGLGTGGEGYRYFNNNKVEQNIVICRW